MQLKSKKYLFDIQQACSRILKYVTEKSFADYEQDDMLRSAVERQFEIIGEAISQLRKIDTETVEQIPEYRKIVAFRNILIHGYATIENATVWGVIESDLKPLNSAVNLMLK